MDFPIKLTISAVVVTCMLALATLILVVGWHGVRELTLNAATKTAQDSGSLINLRARAMLEPAHAVLRQLASDPLAQAKTLEQRLARVRSLSDALVDNVIMASIYVGYTDGSFMLVRPLDSPEVRAKVAAPPKANFMVQSVERLPHGQVRGEYLFFDTARDILQRRPMPEYQFDPRTRPWFKASMQSSELARSAPYVFFTTGQVGVTLSQRSHDDGAVFAVDVLISDMASVLAELRITPHTELALVDAKQRVLAYPDMDRVLLKQGDQVQFRTLEEIDVPSLASIGAMQLPHGEAANFMVRDEEWLGVALPFDLWPGDGMRLLIAAPTDELLGTLRNKRRWLIASLIGVALLLLPLGWWAGSGIGRNIDRLSAQVLAIGRFDFRHDQLPMSPVREVNRLSAAMNTMGHLIQTFLRISHDMASEPKVDRMLSQVLSQLVIAARCRAGAVYLWNAETQSMELSATGGDAADAFDPFLGPSDLVGEETTGGSQVDAERSRRRLLLRGRSGQLQGLLELRHGGDLGQADANFNEFVGNLSGMLAVSIETRQLIESQRNLFLAVIRLMADAIDAKSPYTGGHCERVPDIAIDLVDRMSADTTGAFATFHLSEEERYEFHLGAWLHDCGKVTSPEHIVDKATKLETIYNRIHEVRTRFEVLWRDAEIDHLRRLLAGEDEAASLALQQQRQRQLRADYALVAHCNLGAEHLPAESAAELDRIGAQTWLRHFDHRLGLSDAELSRMGAQGQASPSLPAVESLLADRPEHLVPWNENRPPVEKGNPANRYGFDMSLPPCQQNMGELHNLRITRGTLSEEDRFKINEHIVQTLILLRQLPWPAHLARVPDIAASHHERIDGGGYPRRLKDEQLSTVDRVMAVADVFEALTAADRPYRSPKMLSESLTIMARMCGDGHLDTDVYRYFLRSGLWKDFAMRQLLPTQIDEVDLASIERHLPERRSLRQVA